MHNKNITSIVIAIDTEQYSGNFERQMCAYITGQIGECGVGKEIAAAEAKNIKWFNKHVTREDDDSDFHCYRPTSIWETPGWFNNGAGKHFKDTVENIEKAKEKAIKFITDYHSKQKEMIEERIKNQDFESTKTGWTEKACHRTLKNIEQSIQKVKESTTQYPAYLSVAIFVDKIPPENVMDEITQRAKDFATKTLNYNNNKPYNLTLTGFRVLEPSTIKPKKTLFKEIKKFSPK